MRVLLGAMLLSIACVLSATAGPLSGQRVYVCAIPFWRDGSQDPFRSDLSARAQLDLANHVKAAGVLVLEPGDSQRPLEELTAFAATQDAALSVGVRSFHVEANCVALHVPPMPNDSSSSAGETSQEQLRQFVKHVVTVSRAKESRRLADLIGGLVPICSGAREEAADYFLAGSAGPAVVVELRREGRAKGPGDPTSAGALLEGVARGIRAWCERE